VLSRTTARPYILERKLSLEVCFCYLIDILLLLRVEKVAVILGRNKTSI